jgi:hypothetical protein
MPFFAWGRSLLLGWVALLAIAYVERLLLSWTAPLFGAVWAATAHLALDCLTLAAAGWVVGRTNRAWPLLTALLFAGTLAFWDFGSALALNVPWLLRLAWNSLQDSRYLDALLTAAETHVLLFGCLFAGAMLSRPRAEPLSIGASKKMRE